MPGVSSSTPWKTEENKGKTLNKYCNKKNYM